MYDILSFLVTYLKRGGGWNRKRGARVLHHGRMARISKPHSPPETRAHFSFHFLLIKKIRGARKAKEKGTDRERKRERGRDTLSTDIIMLLCRKAEAEWLVKRCTQPKRFHQGSIGIANRWTARKCPSKGAESKGSQEPKTIDTCNV